MLKEDITGCIHGHFASALKCHFVLRLFPGCVTLRKNITLVELHYRIDSKTGMAVSRMLSTPGYVPPTAEESKAIIERANEEEDLRRAGLLP